MQASAILLTILGTLGITCNLVIVIFIHGIAWYCIALNGTVLYCMVLQGNAWYCMILYGIDLYYIVLNSVYISA